ncbi:GtrA family protein [Streptomyces albus]|uniref:GtrA family protein n=1 Tax=Streptomyces albus TaxID=1888 RepID=UPI0033E050C1
MSPRGRHRRAGEERWRSLWAEVVGFASVGALACAADLGGFLLLRGPAGWDAMAAKACSFVAGVTVAYVGNALGPYRARGRRPAGAWRRFAVFTLVNAAGGAVQLGCLAFSRHVLGLTSVLADVVSGAGVGLLLGTAVRFWGTRTLVFSPASAPVPDAVRTERGRTERPGAGPVATPDGAATGPRFTSRHRP